MMQDAGMMGQGGGPAAGASTSGGTEDRIAVAAMLGSPQFQKR
jgi:hypothetical protein